MGAAESQQPAFDRVLRMLRARRIAKALRRDGGHGSKRVLDAMVKFFQDEPLQLVRRFAFLGVDAGLGQQGLGAELGLRQQQPKTDVLCHQKLLGRRRVGLQAGGVLIKVDFEHRQQVPSSSRFRSFLYCNDFSRMAWEYRDDRDFSASSMSGMAEHIPHLRDHFAGAERLSEEAAVWRNIYAREVQL